VYYQSTCNALSAQLTISACGRCALRTYCCSFRSRCSLTSSRCLASTYSGSSDKSSSEIFIENVVCTIVCPCGPSYASSPFLEALPSFGYGYSRTKNPTMPHSGIVIFVRSSVPQNQPCPVSFIYITDIKTKVHAIVRLAIVITAALNYIAQAHFYITSYMHAHTSSQYVFM
jgi:hypothetical protein